MILIIKRKDNMIRLSTYIIINVFFFRKKNIIYAYFKYN